MGSALPLWRKPNFLHYWLPPLLCGLAVLSLSGGMGSGAITLAILKWLFSWFVDLKLAQLEIINFLVRKTGHVLAYGLIYFLWFRAFRAQAHYGPGRACLWSLGFCLFYALMNEGYQSLCASREAGIGDIILDMSGAGLAALIAGAVWMPGAKTAVISGIAEGQIIGPE